MATDDLLARADEHLNAGEVPLDDDAVATGLIADLSDEVRALTAERDELRIAIHGGCGCPAPYTECPHDEPLLRALNRARTERAAMEQVLDAARRRLPAEDPTQSAENQT